MLLRHIRYLLALTEHRNFTRAADALHVSQPALSQQTPSGFSYSIAVAAPSK
jgi:DNA-binding transcriptional LysR family regulator